MTDHMTYYSGRKGAIWISAWDLQIASALPGSSPRWKSDACIFLAIGLTTWRPDTLGWLVTNTEASERYRDLKEYLTPHGVFYQQRNLFQ